MAKHELNYGVIVDSLNEAIKYTSDCSKIINEEIYKLQDLSESRARIVINNKTKSYSVDYDLSVDSIYSALVHMMTRKDDDKFYIGTQKARDCSVKCVSYFKPYKTKKGYIGDVLYLLVRLFESKTIKKALKLDKNTRELLLAKITKLNQEDDE
jgi:hypothetical protein